MTVSRRDFVADTSVFALLASVMPELGKAQDGAPQASAEDAPHDSYDFWHGFFDSVNPNSPQGATRGPKDQLPDPNVETQYLHYDGTAKKLLYATDIEKDTLLDHQGDVMVAVTLSQYRPAASTKAANTKGVQLRLDTTQIHPLLSFLSPLSWSAIASVQPDKSGNVSLDQSGLNSPEANKDISKILLTRGTGKMAVNISQAPAASMFVKVLNVILQGVKAVAPMVTLPAISVPALDAFTQAMSYWEDRTRFIMAGNLTSVVATQQALKDPDTGAHYIGLVSGDYLMVAQQHVDELAKELPNLDLVQGYLVRKGADANLPLQNRQQSAVPDITYASMRVTVQPLNPASASSTTT